MPIIDYEKQFRTNFKLLELDGNISKTNLEHVKDYLSHLDANSKSSASKSLFCSHIRRFLNKCPEDIRDLFEDKKRVNRILSEIKQENIGEATYQTTSARSKTLARWLNDGETPKGFKDIRRVIVKRNLTPADMLSNEEINKLIQTSEDVQVKAMISLLLDSGLRPSEFYDLNVGDISKSQQFMRVDILQGKTGSRNVILYHCIPELSEWLNMHPVSNDPKAPLWVRMYHEPISRPTQAAIRKRIHRVFVKAGITKPHDFYALRHNANVRKKREGVDPEIASKMAGHSLKMYSDTYGRLCPEDMEHSLSKTYGLEVREKQKDTLKKCSCGHMNASYSDFCSSCGEPMSYRSRMKREIDQNKSIEDKINKILNVKLSEKISKKLNK